MKQLVLKVHPKDNVLVALQDLQKGQLINYNGETFILQEDIKAKHKFFTTDLQQGDKVIMYGVLVGTVQKDIGKASWMSTDNIKHAAEPYIYRNTNYKWNAPDVSKFMPIKLLMVTTEQMEMLVQQITGYLFLQYFVKIEIWM